MSLTNHKLIDLDQLAYFRDLLDAKNGIWYGTAAEYESQKTTITSRFVAITDDGVPISFVESSIPDDEELDDIVFNDTKPNPSPSTPGNEATDEDLDDILGGK